MRSITARFALMLALAAVLPLLGFGAMSVLSLQSGTTETVITGNQNVARRAAEQIDQYVLTTVKILRAVSADLQHTGLEPWQQDRILKNYVLQFPEFTELTLFDPAGQPLVSSRIGTSRVTVPDPRSLDIGGALMSRLTVDDDLLPTAVIGVPLAGTGTGGGWLVGAVNLEELWRMVDRIRVGQQGYALLVASEGQLLAHGDPGAKSRVARGDNLASHPLVQAAHSATPGARLSEEYDTTRGRVLAVAAPVGALGWTVIVEQPLVEAFAVADRLQLQLVVSIGLALLITVLAGAIAGRSFIRPILELMRGTTALAEGRMDQRVQVRGRDEIAQLGLAFNDMADRLVTLQDDLRKKERQAMFGRIAAGLVHDLSHPIQNVGNSCKLIVRMWEDHEYRETFTRTVTRELSEVKRVLDDLRNLARPLPLEKFPMDVNAAITELAESMQSTVARAGLAVESNLAFGPLYIEADRFALNRVLRNLVINAAQATNPGGRIIVSTERMQERAVIRVSDTGCGIPAERLGAIFEDFVTTKRRGLGLGLAISKKIVDQMEGTIAVESEVGRGSTFTLAFATTKARPSKAVAG